MLITSCNIFCNNRWIFSIGKKVKGSGTIITKQKSFSDVRAIDFSSSGDLEIIQGNTETLSIEADDNIMDNLIAAYSSGTLTIKQDPVVFLIPSRTIKFRLTVKNPNLIKLSGSGNVFIERISSDSLSVSISGSGKIHADSIDCNNFKIAISGSGSLKISYCTVQNLNADITGSGSVYLMGTGQSQSIRINGSGRYDGGSYTTKTTAIDVIGSGSGNICASENLEASVSGSGIIIYGGNPQDVKSSQSESGHIRKSAS